MLYFEEPDTTAHSFGPESAQVLSYIQKVGMPLFKKSRDSSVSIVSDYRVDDRVTGV
jgi:hypothetical protein